MGLFSDWVDEHIRPDDTEMTGEVELTPFAQSAAGGSFTWPTLDVVLDLTTDNGTKVLGALAGVGAGVSFPDGNRDWDWSADYDFDIEGADIILTADAHYRVLRIGGEPNYSGGATVAAAIAVDFAWMDLSDDPIEVHVPLLSPDVLPFFQSFRDFFFELV